MSLRLGALAIAVTLGGCEVKPPFERTNPYDGGNGLALSLDGPDSVHSYNEELAYAIVSDPPLPPGDYIVKWFVYSDMSHPLTGQPIVSNDILASGDGTLAVLTATAQYRRYTVIAQFGETLIGRVLFTGQKATTLELSCAPWTAPLDDCTANVRMNATLMLHARAHDPNGFELRSVQFAVDRAQVTLRDPTVAARVAGEPGSSTAVRLVALAPGSTWVVVRIDDAIDSVRVNVVP